MLLLILKLLAHSSSDGRGRKELLTLCFLGNVSRQLLLSLRGLLGQRPRTKQKKLWYQQHLSLLRFVSYINLSESCRIWCNYPLDHNSELYSDVECCLQAGFHKENDKLGQKAGSLSFLFCFWAVLSTVLNWTTENLIRSVQTKGKCTDLPDPFFHMTCWLVFGPSDFFKSQTWSILTLECTGT